MSTSSSAIVDRFKNDLEEAERSRAADSLANLFAPGATLQNLGGNETQDARSFWQVYLEQFNEIRSDFSHGIVCDNAAALEWRSRGVLRDGAPVEYSGISILEIDGDTISAFRAYYDSAAFVKSGAPVLSS